MFETFQLFVMFFGCVSSDILFDVNKYNANFNGMVKTDYKHWIEMRDRNGQIFSEVGGTVGKVFFIFLNSPWQDLNNLEKNATNNLINGMMKRNKNFHEREMQLFDMLSDNSLENSFDEVILTPRIISELLFERINTTRQAYAQKQYPDYCFDAKIGPLAVMKSLVDYVVVYCQIPNDYRLFLHDEAAETFEKFEKTFSTDSEFKEHQSDFLNFILFSNDDKFVDKNVQELKKINVTLTSDLYSALSELVWRINQRHSCWLKKAYNSKQHKFNSFEKFASVVMAAAIDLDDKLMTCNSMNESMEFIKTGAEYTKIIGNHIHKFREHLIKTYWPKEIVKDIRKQIPDNFLPVSEFNKTSTKIKHSINLLVEETKKFHVILTTKMEPENIFTTCVNGTDCLNVESSDVTVLAFVFKSGANTNRTQKAQAYFRACRSKIDKVFGKFFGELPGVIWTKIKEKCPKLQNFYRHIYLSTGFTSNGGIKIGWSLNDYDSYEHVYKYFEPGPSVTGQGYHFFGLMD